MQDQVIALSGVLQSCDLVDEIARTGTCDQNALETAVHSLFETNPKNTLDVFGSIEHLKNGLQLTCALMGRTDDVRDSNWLRYALTVMHLEPRLRKHATMMDQLARGRAQAESPRNHFGLMHENTIASLAKTYQDTISTFSTRIKVNGKPQVLQSPHHADKIRMLLLSAMRSAILWKQVNGHRWHLLFKRRKMLNIAEDYLGKLQKPQREQLQLVSKSLRRSDAAWLRERVA